MAQVSGTLHDAYRIMGHRNSFHIKITTVLEGLAGFEVAVMIAVL
jgi:hypothetical protein